MKYLKKILAFVFLLGMISTMFLGMPEYITSSNVVDHSTTLSQGGPADSFEVNPVNYWTHDSVGINVTYIHDQQVVLLENSSNVLYSNGWGKRKMISINGSVGATTNYQVRIDIVYDSDMQSDFDDLRFYDDDDTTELDYWIESYVSSTSAIVWVEVIDNLNTDQIIYMYYDNSVVSTTSNGEETFLFFDDFDDASLDGSKWYELYSDGSYSEAGGYLTVSADASGWEGIGSKSQYAANHSFVTYGRTSDNNKDGAYIGPDDRSADGSYAGTQIDQATFGYNDETETRREGVSETQSESVTYTSDSRFEIKTFSTSVIFYLDNVLINTHSTQVPTDDMGMTYVLKASQDIIMDWTFVRKCILVEPVVDSFGEERLANVDLDIGVPVEIKDNQEIKIQYDNSQLGDNVTVQMYFLNDGVSSGYVLNVTSTGISCQGTTYNYSGYIISEFFINSVDTFYRLKSYGQNGTYLGTYDSYGSIVANDEFRIQSTNFTGRLTLHSISGTTDYAVARSWPENYVWETVEEDTDEDVAISLYGMKTLDDDDDIDADATYRKQFNYFSFIRLLQDWICLPDDGTGEYTHDYECVFHWRLWYPNGTERVSIKFTWTFGGDTIGVGGSWMDSAIAISVDGVDQGYTVGMNDDTITNNGEGNSHIGIWRTLENHVGVMWSSDCYMYTLDGEDDPFDDIENHKTWISAVAIDDWENSTIDISYEVDQQITGDAVVYCDFGFKGVEYHEYYDNGIPEPHFSSTLWEFFGDVFTTTGQIIGNVAEMIYNQSIWNNDSWISQNTILDEIFAADTVNATDPWTFLTTFVGSMGNSFAFAISPLITMLNAYFETLPEDFLSEILGISGFDFNLQNVMMNTIVSAFGEDFVALFMTLDLSVQGIGTMIASFASFLVYFIDVGNYVVSFIPYYLNIIANNLELVYITLWALPVIGLIFGGKKGFMFVLNGYWYVFTGFFNACWRLFFDVTNTVGNWFPLT